ncbi:CCA tRNA nucleotidyltransferase [Sphingomonas sp. SUN039]|uniref:CCA tRNA nucleotidyltransferase n=1 Tax=Sphingomonas sp. SUN039 TaxID=2937787 RepID=UPI0021649179|nr:CCA tRNA nucleotidyltransferase [Sphingomonas sp. SUN039]UVO52715.1 CCA tRNA nucleotidyltransferase [Sphingomonas sp. SUN039]
MVVLPEAGWRTRAGMAALIAALGGPDDARFVGGAVRDSLLGLPVSDVDVATRLRPDDVMARLKAAGIKAVPTGLAHGTVTAVTDGGPVEVTTLRRDVSTDGRHATVAFSDDWQEDASRRDFTINALYADPVTGAVFDWFGGLADLDARRVRFIGDPLTRIAEDHLRILRFFRFHARFGAGAPDAAALAACTARANDLMALSRERIAAELLKLLAADDPVPDVRVMIEQGIFVPVLPEIVDAAPLAVLVAREAAAGVAGDPVRRLSALIAPDPALARDIAARLKLSNHVAKRLATAAARHDDRPDALAYRYGPESAVDLVLLGNGPEAEARKLDAWQRPQLPLGGGTLIARGLAPGPIVARTLGRIEDRWVEAGFPDGRVLEAIVTEELSRAR